MHTSKKTHQKIIDTAISLFADKGYENVTIKDICSALKFGRSTFYYHFRTKEQILSEYYSSSSAYTTENMSYILSAENDIERAFRIQLVYENHLSSIGSDQAIIHFITSALHSPNKDYGLSIDKVRQLLIPVIKQCQSSGQIKNMTDATKLCDVAIQIQSGIVLQYFLLGEKFDRSERLIESLKVLYGIES